MEMKVTEFEEYVAALSVKLRVEADIKDDICSEIRQNLYDKYNELLIKGYGIEPGIVCTLESFEAPDVLAKMFNDIHGAGIDFSKAFVFMQNRKVMLAALVATILMAFIV